MFLVYREERMGIKVWRRTGIGELREPVKKRLEILESRMTVLKRPEGHASWWKRGEEIEMIIADGEVAHLESAIAREDSADHDEL
jgi:hypothetical protein